MASDHNGDAGNGYLETLESAQGLKAIARLFIRFAQTDGDDRLASAANARQLLRGLGVLFNAAAQSDLYDVELGLGESASNFGDRNADGSSFSKVLSPVNNIVALLDSDENAKYEQNLSENDYEQGVSRYMRNDLISRLF